MRFTCRLREARGDGEWLPPLSLSPLGAVIPNLGALGICEVSESLLLLGQSFSESLGPIALLL